MSCSAASAIALGLSAVLLSCARTSSANSLDQRSAKATSHRISAGVAPVHLGSYLGAFGDDETPSSDTNINNFAFGATISGRYTYAIIRGLEVGGDVGLIKPYLTRWSLPDMRKLTQPWLALLVRPHLWLSEATDIGAYGRIGYAIAFWGARVGNPALIFGGGLEVRHWVNAQLAIGGELEVERVAIRIPDRTNDEGIRAHGTVLSPSVRITWAPSW